MSRQIPLPHSQFALVDEQDYGELSSYRWFCSSTGQVVGLVPINGRFQLVVMARFILSAAEDEQVDHLNGDLLDHRRDNLRIRTLQQKGHPERQSALSLAQLRGVGWHKRRHKYHARIQLEGIRYHLGFFDDAEMTALAYDEAARRLLGDKAVCKADSTMCGRSGGPATEAARLRIIR